MAINLTLNGVTYPIPEVGDVDWGDGYTKWVRAANAQLAQGGSGTSSTPWVSVKDYGAIGDGSTDDTTAVKAAMAVVAASGALGGTLYFPKGNYRIASTLQFGVAATQANVKLVGEGASASTLLKYGAFSATPLVEFRNSDNWGISGLGFDGTHDSGTGDLLLIDGSSYGLVDTSKFANSKRYGINATKVNGAARCQHNTQLSNQFTSNATANIHADAGALSTYHDTGVLHAHDYGVLGDGITDCTTGIQAMLTAANGHATQLYFPPGVYRMTDTVTYHGDSGSPLHFVGAAGGSFSSESTSFTWYGAAGGTMFHIRGANSSLFENINFQGANIAKALVWHEWDSSTGTGSSNCYYRKCNFADFKGSALVAIGGVVRASNVVTVTSAAHGFVVGEQVSCVPESGTDANFPDTNFATNIKTITAVTANTFSYAETGSNATSTLAHTYVSLLSAGILLGNTDGDGTHQSDTVSFQDCYFSGGNGGAIRGWAGIKTAVGGNTKIFRLQNCGFQQSEVGIDLTPGSGYNNLMGVSFGNIRQVMMYLGIGPTNIIGAGGENGTFTPGPYIIYGGTGGGAPGLSMRGGYFEGNAPKDGYLIRYNDSMLLEGCWFRNSTSNTALPKIQSGGTVSQPECSFISRGNAYANCTSHVPLYDGSDNDYFGEYGKANPLRFESYNDLGYAPPYIGLPTYFENVQGVPTVSNNCKIQSIISGTGVTVHKTGEPRRTTHKITVDYRAWTGGTATTLNIGYPGTKTKVCEVIADTTIAYAGTAGTLTLTVDVDAAAGAFLLSHDVKTAAVTKGLLDADLGTYLSKAGTRLSGGYYVNWSGAPVGILKATLTSSSGSLSGLTAGSTTFYIVTESFPL